MEAKANNNTVGLSYLEENGKENQREWLIARCLWERNYMIIASVSAALFQGILWFDDHKYRAVVYFMATCFCITAMISGMCHKIQLRLRAGSETFKDVEILLQLSPHKYLSRIPLDKLF
jgi:hypothetical protein